MRFSLLLSLAFLSGIYGFVIFAPYALIVCTVGIVIQARMAAPAATPVVAEISNS